MVESSCKHIVVVCDFFLPAIPTQMLTEDFVCLQKLFPLKVDHLIHVQLPQIKLQTDQLVKASLFKAWHYLPTFVIFSSIGNYVLGAVQTVLKRQTVPRARNVVSL